MNKSKMRKVANTFLSFLSSWGKENSGKGKLSLSFKIDEEGIKEDIKEDVKEQIDLNKYEIIDLKPKINRDLNEDLTVKADLDARAWAKATSLFGDRTTIEFNNLLVAPIIKTQAILRKK